MNASQGEKLDREHLLEAVSAAQGFFISHRDIGEIFDQLLVQLLGLTDSEYGYIGEVLRDEAGRPYLKTHAISNIAWNEETRRFYEENAPNGLEFRNLDTLFGQVMAHEVPVIANDPANDPRAGGLPPGHLRLDAFLGLPMFVDGELVGSAGISNRPGGYDEEIVEFLQPFLATCAQLIVAHRGRRRQAEDELRAKHLVSVVSHELRTPMTAIRGALGLLVGLHGDTLTDEADELVQLAHKGCERMLHLLDDLLDVHRIEAGELVLRLGPCDLSALIRTSAEVFRSLANQAGVELVLSCELPLRVEADEARVCQVLSNLIGNAIKHTPPGTVVRVSCRDAGDRVCVDVMDDGPGIPADQLQAIFRKFGRLPGQEQRGQGLGLGLYVSRALMEGHRGQLHMRSELGEGACFTMEFPKPWTHAPEPLGVEIP
ncbi:MAG: GAF domain-containing sensor histidine kinase [Alphaproteobacteria bacterium]|nr:GAF domain-containing sensor histidine kinase [Alphaproteobacteria bacterium]MCB9792236.1 GAF domain-containing sensor histidine kinase [Alphaproteobacteria bacterium]